MAAGGAGGEAGWHASPTTRLETVARLLAEFRQAGFRRVTFYGSPRPPPAFRAARPMPYPGGALRTSQQVLDFAVIDGDRERLGRAEQIIRRRLSGAGIDDVGIERTKNGIRIALPAIRRCRRPGRPLPSLRRRGFGISGSMTAHRASFRSMRIPDAGA